MYKKLTIFSILFVLMDQVVKMLVSNFIPYQGEIKIIPNFFYITNVHNEGAAWSLFSGNVFILALLGLVALLLIYYFFIKGKELNKWEILLYSLLIGGITGNFIDRIFLGHVVDYIGVILGSYYFPIFNIADIGIVVSVFMMIIFSIREELVCKKSKLQKK